MQVGYGLDPNLAEKMLTSEFMDAGAQRAEPLIALQRTYAPQAEMWVGEIAAAWHSGRPNVTNRFESSLWYADALASMAKRNLTGFLRQTLRGGNYGLLSACCARNRRRALCRRATDTRPSRFGVARHRQTVRRTSRTPTSTRHCCSSS